MSNDAHGASTLGPVITTSWDDGVAWDLRLATSLTQRGMAGTFYVADCGWRNSKLDDPSIRELRDLGMEIGGHTVSHPDLRSLKPSDIVSEVTDNRRRLEDVLGQQVGSFCYPYGYCNRRVADVVREQGFSLGRTNVSHAVGASRDPLRQAVTWQLYPHSTFSYVKHAVRSVNVAGILRALRWHNHAEVDSVADLVANGDPRVVIHLWGHSWEIDEFDMWPQLDRVLDQLAEIPGARFVPNADAYGTSVR